MVFDHHAHGPARGLFPGSRRGPTLRNNRRRSVIRRAERDLVREGPAGGGRRQHTHRELGIPRPGDPLRACRAGEIDAPDDAVRVDLTGKTVIPAFLDIHSHVGYENVPDNTQLKKNYTRENLVDHLERYAYTGHAITVSLGSDPSEDWVWQMREDSEQPSFSGARFETVGRGLVWPGTGPGVAAKNDTPYAIFTPVMAEVEVRELAGHGVPFVKLWVEDRNGFQVPGREGTFVLTPDISKAAIVEAHELGLRTMAHVKTVPELKDLLRAGVDMWTHPIADTPADGELMALHWSWSRRVDGFGLEIQAA